MALAGPCPLNEVPDWLFRCDVLLELLREDRPDSDVISGRLYEYLSTGKPIVSMLWPEQVEIFPDVVYGAHDEREFLTLCQHALEEAPGFVSQRRQSYGAAAGPPSRCGIPYFGHCRPAVSRGCQLFCPVFRNSLYKPTKFIPSLAKPAFFR